MTKVNTWKKIRGIGFTLVMECIELTKKVFLKRLFGKSKTEFLEIPLYRKEVLI